EHIAGYAVVRKDALVNMHFALPLIHMLTINEGGKYFRDPYHRLLWKKGRKTDMTTYAPARYVDWFWYIGRHELDALPRKAEVTLRTDDALLEAEVVALAWRFFVSLALQGVELVVNSLGDAGDRAAYAGALRDHFGRRSAELAPETRETLARNPLRVLDSKRETDAAALADAPRLGEFLSDGARGHFARFTAGLDALGVPFRVDERLVRGLDYYRRTTFEFVASSLEGAQNAVGGGGRYDGLVEDLGGPATGGVGFALGVDRTLLACDAEGVFPAETGSVDVFVVDTSDGTAALRITDVLRASGWSADRAFDGRSMKSQMKSADRSGARLAVIVGPDEAASGTCTVRDMGDSTQATISQDALAAHVAGLIGPRTPRRTQ
ncbi:MAG: histidine--tRNA ligase, partial [Actinomycetota bacterium]